MAPIRDVPRPEVVTRSLLHGPNRLWSLWDMMNFMLPTYVSLLQIIDGMQRYSSSQAGQRMEPGEHRTHLENDLKTIKETATKLELKGVLARIDRIEGLLAKTPFWADCASQLITLKEAFEDDSKELFIYV